MRLVAACVALVATLGSVDGTIFSVGHAGYVGRDGKIWFQNILEDQGYWNQYRSYYEAVEPGYYMFNFHALSRRGSPVTLELRKNNREVLAAYGDGEGYNTASNSGVFYLNRRDRVALHVVQGHIHESSDSSRNYNTLSGFKISRSEGDFPPLRPGTERPFPHRPFFVPEAAGAPGPKPSGIFPVSGRPQPEEGRPAGGPGTATAPEQGGEDGFVPLETGQGGPQ